VRACVPPHHLLAISMMMMMMMMVVVVMVVLVVWKLGESIPVLSPRALPACLDQAPCILKGISACE
jgi:hypothetical protein